jgi:hypothetical protein
MTKTILLSIAAVAIVGTGAFLAITSGTPEINVAISPVATTSTNIASTTPVTVSVATSTPTKAEPAPVTAPTPAPKPKPAPVAVTPPPPVSNPTPTTPPNTGTTGETILGIRGIPLLSGGTAHTGQTVSVSYLQVKNFGKEGAFLKGFWVAQNGSASTQSIVQLSTVDDTGTIRDVSATMPFQNGSGFAPTNAYFAPGQTRLFTIKVTLASDISVYAGTELMIVVTSMDTTAEVRKNDFPIEGTIWTIAQ